MSSKILSGAFALMLAIGATATLSLTPAYATDGRTAAQTCIDRDDCSMSLGDNGSFTIVFDGGGVIWCPSLDGECVVVSPDVGRVNRHGPIVAAPISPVQAPKLPGPVGSNPTGSKPTRGKPVTVVPVGVAPVSVIKPIGATPGKSQAPVVLLARGGRGR